VKVARPLGLVRTVLSASHFVVGLFALGLSNTTLALGLGEIQSSSGLNEPLEASIDLLGVTPEELSSLVIGLSPANQYQRAGLNRGSIHARIEFSLRHKGRNSFVRLTTNQPVTEPLLILLITATWDQGSVSREYSIFLDPPILPEPLVDSQPPAELRPAVSPVRAEARSITRSTDPSTRSNATATAANPRFQAGDAYGPVKRGETLSAISAKLIEGTQYRRNVMALALYEANPEAFSGNVNTLKLGARLRMPDEATLRGMNNKAATSRLRELDTSTNRSTSRSQAKGRTESAVNQSQGPSNGNLKQSDQGRLSIVPVDQSSSQATAAGRGEPSNQGGGNGRVASAAGSVGGVNDRVDQLESRVAELRTLLEIRADEIAKLESRLRDDRDFSGIDGDQTQVNDGQVSGQITSGEGNATQSVGEFENNMAENSGAESADSAESEIAMVAPPEFVAGGEARPTAAEGQVENRPEEGLFASITSIFSGNLFGVSILMILMVLALLVLLLFIIFAFLRSRGGTEKIKSSGKDTGAFEPFFPPEDEDDEAADDKPADDPDELPAVATRMIDREPAIEPVGAADLDDHAEGDELEQEDSNTLMGAAAAVVGAVGGGVVLAAGDDDDEEEVEPEQTDAAADLQELESFDIDEEAVEETEIDEVSEVFLDPEDASDDDLSSLDLNIDKDETATATSSDDDGVPASESAAKATVADDGEGVDFDLEDFTLPAVPESKPRDPDAGPPTVEFDLSDFEPVAASTSDVASAETETETETDAEAESVGETEGTAVIAEALSEIDSAESVPEIETETEVELEVEVEKETETEAETISDSLLDLDAFMTADASEVTASADAEDVASEVDPTEGSEDEAIVISDADSGNEDEWFGDSSPDAVADAELDDDAVSLDMPLEESSDDVSGTESSLGVDAEPSSVSSLTPEVIQDVEPEPGPEPAPVVPAGSPRAAQRLELARAFMEMGDTNEARRMLDEVVADGSPEQQAEANKLLDGLED